jgi:nucleotidyltransferase/DNA polymerase involved in DNA repair
VAAATPAAQRCGVQVAMRSQAARLACPNLHLLPLDLHASRAHQAAYLAVLGEWELPVEAQGWGLAYIDLRGVAESRTAVQPLAADLGRRLRVARGGSAAAGAELVDQQVHGARGGDADHAGMYEAGRAGGYCGLFGRPAD